MSRLGIWGEGTPFRTFDDFLHAIEKRFVLLTSIVFSESVLIFWINIHKMDVLTGKIPSNQSAVVSWLNMIE